MKRNRRIFFLLVFAGLLLLFNGCKENNVLIIFPMPNDNNVKHLDMHRVCNSYKLAAEGMIKEKSNKGPFKSIKLVFINQSEGIDKELKKEGMAALDKYLNVHNAKIAIYSEIIQPYNDVDYFYCKTHLYIVSSGARTHQSKKILMGEETFYAPEFWKSEFRDIFSKLVGVV